VHVIETGRARYWRAVSPENVEIVRRTYEAVRMGDLDTANSYIHPEIEFHTYAY
jgi:hypothetical protein